MKKSYKLGSKYIRESFNVCFLQAVLYEYMKICCVIFQDDTMQTYVKV